MQNDKIYSVAIIYNICFPNNKHYVGRFCGSIKKLQYRYFNKELDGTRPVNYAIKKHGIENIKINIIETLYNCTNQIINKREIYWIKYHMSLTTQNGYNVTDGGDGGDNFTNNPNKEAIREKIRSKMNMHHPMKNRHHTDETKELLSVRAKERIKNGQEPPMKNKHHTNESKNKISNKLSGKYVGVNNKHYIIDFDKKIIDELIYSKKNSFRTIFEKYNVSQRILMRYLLKYYGDSSLDNVRKKLMIYYSFNKMDFENFVLLDYSGRKICKLLKISRNTMILFMRDYYACNSINEFKLLQIKPDFKKPFKDGYDYVV